MKNSACRQRALLENWQREAEAILDEIGEKVRLRRGQQLSTLDVYYVIEGLCALCMESELGKEISIIYFYPGRLMNFLPCLRSFYRQRREDFKKPSDSCVFFVKVIKDSLVLRIDHTRFLEQYFSSLPLHSFIVQSLVENFSDVYSHLFNLREMPAWQRVAGEILACMDSKKPHGLLRAITYAELATRHSLHPVTVAKIFKALQREGIIERQRKTVIVLDPERLGRVATGQEQFFYARQAGREKEEDENPE